jgi:hypothetical protein
MEIAMARNLPATATVLAAMLFGFNCQALDGNMPFHQGAERVSLNIPVRGERNAPEMILYYAIGNLGGFLAVCGAYVTIGKALPGYEFDEALRAMSISVRDIAAVTELDYFPEYENEVELKRSTLGCKLSERRWKKNYGRAKPKLSLKDWVVRGR